VNKFKGVNTIFDVNKLMCVNKVVDVNNFCGGGHAIGASTS